MDNDFIALLGRISKERGEVVDILGKKRTRSRSSKAKISSAAEVPTITAAVAPIVPKVKPVKVKVVKVIPNISPLTYDNMYIDAGGSECDEHWKPVPEFHNYAISTLGRVKTNLPDGVVKVIPLIKQCNDYPRVLLRCGSRTSCRVRHRLVAEVFKPIPEDKAILKRPLVVNHIDENKNNPNVKNLEWLTNSENFDYTGKMAHKRAVDQRQKEIDDFVEATASSIIDKAGII